MRARVCLRVRAPVRVRPYVCPRARARACLRTYMRIPSGTPPVEPKTRRIRDWRTPARIWARFRTTRALRGSFANNLLERKLQMLRSLGAIMCQSRENCAGCAKSATRLAFSSAGGVPLGRLRASCGSARGFPEAAASQRPAKHTIGPQGGSFPIGPESTGEPSENHCGTYSMQGAYSALSFCRVSIFLYRIWVKLSKRWVTSSELWMKLSEVCPKLSETEWNSTQFHPISLTVH